MARLPRLADVWRHRVALEASDRRGYVDPVGEDTTFGEFADLLKKERDTTVRATPMGRFLARKRKQFGARCTSTDTDIWAVAAS